MGAAMLADQVTATATAWRHSGLADDYVEEGAVLAGGAGDPPCWPIASDRWSASRPLSARRVGCLSS